MFIKPTHYEALVAEANSRARWTNVGDLKAGDRIKFTNLPDEPHEMERIVRRVRPPQEGEAVWTIEVESTGGESMRAHEFVARWLHDMDTATEWEDETQSVRDQYLRDTDAFLQEPQNLAIRAEAWDEAENSFRQFCATLSTDAPWPDNPYRQA